MSYYVETASSAAILSKAGKELMADGFIPVGGVAVCVDRGNNLIFAQAFMIPPSTQILKENSK